MAINVLVIGDIVGKLGRRTAASVLPRLRDEHAIDLVVANGENAAGGRGLTSDTVRELRDAGIDVITSGNHVWAKKEVFPILDDPGQSVIRPLNYPPGAPGRGIHQQDGIAVINLIGRTFMGDAVDCPFRAADRALEELSGTETIIVDMHAEATSEKIAIGRYLDGRVSAVVGTHTHVPTSDTRVLSAGTAYVTDLGMVGARESVLGMEYEPVLERFLTQLPSRWEPVEKGPAVFNSVLISIGDEGRATAIQRVDCEIDE
ncbi:MAG TPA: TIGR00282 family metallophosphoesterase [Dehalococcoidia bacterium]|nr:TIGR00282 family metallophosphoesterase [Dehalococcoidia bacterium]